MTEILPPMSGKKIDKLFGNGSIALLTDERLFVLYPTRYNRVEHCITLKVSDSEHADNVYEDMSDSDIADALESIQDDCEDVHLTKPMLTRDKSNAWNSAADVLEALAAICREQAKT
jgi:hypothetical protein